MKQYTKIAAIFLWIMGAMSCSSQVLAADEIALPDMAPSAPTLSKPETPQVAPTPPTLDAAAHLLIDATSGKVLSQKDATVRRPPASLTKMMTLYVISSALKAGQITLDTPVPISENAWRTGGSKMFVKVGTEVSVRDLIKGIIVDSGNDACVAMAEYLGGNESSFASMMNQEAQKLGMMNSHFTDSTGLPDPNHYTTAQDLAILARALIAYFPEYYPWYKQKWFTYAGIRQPNRNRLLWRDASVDGIKTGHTEEAGFCLVASAKKEDMRLISVVLGSSSDTSRASDSQALLNYGFHFFETRQIHKAGESLGKARVWKAEKAEIPVGVIKNWTVTLPVGQYKNITITQNVTKNLMAPIKKGQPVGEVVVSLDKDVLAKQPLVALEDDPEGGLWTRTKDAVSLWFSDR